jgi:hypothetical protein
MNVVVVVYSSLPESVYGNVKEPRNRSASLSSLEDVKKGCLIGPPGWESIPGLLKRFKNSGSEGVFSHFMCYLKE